MIESIQNLLSLFESHGATRFYAKQLAPNDNSKNQLYLGGDYSALNIIPYKDIYADESNMAGGKNIRAKANINFFWIYEEGKYNAPDAQLILYPQYPEVRMSGFLNKCEKKPSDIMRVRDEGRVLFLGITKTGEILGHAVSVDNTLAKELAVTQNLEMNGVFLELTSSIKNKKTSKEILLSELERIYEKRWIDSKKLGKNGIQPYNAMNGGGYTLEAELGVSANSYAEPDFMGWEVKQYGVRDFNKFSPKSPITLMTPEPSGGLYQDEGVEKFMHKFAYPDKSGKPNRLNFGGVYSTQKNHHADTGLCLKLEGYDTNRNKITDMDGGIVLLSKNEEVAAKWDFSKMMQHWNRKHAYAAYIPSISKKPPPQYSYGCKVLLAEKTDFDLFLNAVSSGVVYYDPGIKLEHIGNPKQKIKRRSQFRIKHKDLTDMYHKHEWFRFGECRE